MAGETQNDISPLPKIYFSVTFDNGVSGNFQELTGLDTEPTETEYRHGGNPVFYPIRMAGLEHTGNVTLRNGVFAGDVNFRNWHNQISMNVVKRGTAVVNHLDQTGAPRTVWTLNNAWPSKLTGTDMKSEGNEVAVEALEIAFETMTISGGS